MAKDLETNLVIKAKVEGEESLKSIQKTVDKISKTKVEKLSSGLKKLGTSFQNLGKSLTGYSNLIAVGFGAASLKAFDTQAQAIAKVEAGLASTGQTAGFTSKELQAAASELQSLTRFGDEDILSGVTSTLLTFTNITKDQFIETQKQALNLSARMGTDLTSSAIQLGKALNDPVANLSALSRAGIQFSEEQKTLINTLASTNRLAEAQDLILKELETQFGGTAEALAKVGLGPIEQLKNSVGDILEEFGAIIAPALFPLVDFVKEAVKGFQGLSTEIKGAIVLIGGIAAAIGPTLLAVGTAIKVVGTLITFVNPLTIAITAVVGSLAFLGKKVLDLRQNFATWPDTFEFIKIRALITFEEIQIKAFELVNSVGDAFTNIRNTVGGLFGASETKKTDLIDISDDLSDLKKLENRAQDLIEKGINSRQGRDSPSSGDNAQTFKPAPIEIPVIPKVDPIASADALKDSFNIPEVQQAQEEVLKLGETQQLVVNGLENSFSSIIEGTKSIGGAFADMVDSIISDLTRTALRSALSSLVSGIGGSFSTGGEVSTPGFSTGGNVRGAGSSTSDSILARLSDGEFVVNAKTNKFFGSDFFYNLQKFADRKVMPKDLPSFATGGSVGFASGGQVTTSESVQGDVSINLVNNSSNQINARETNRKFNGKNTIIDIILEDLSTNGKITQGLSSSFGLRR